MCHEMSAPSPFHKRVRSREMAAFVIRQVKLLGGASCALFQMQVKVLCARNQIYSVICMCGISQHEQNPGLREA